jgi:hypothetical protein
MTSVSEAEIAESANWKFSIAGSSQILPEKIANIELKAAMGMYSSKRHSFGSHNY